MQSACYIMHGLSLSQRSFTPCCASPPTAQTSMHTHTPTHTHSVPCVDSHILYSSTLTHGECVLSNHQPDEWEGKDKEEECVGWGDWKWKRQRGKLEDRRVHSYIWMKWMCVFTSTYDMVALKKFSSFFHSLNQIIGYLQVYWPHQRFILGSFFGHTVPHHGPDRRKSLRELWWLILLSCAVTPKWHQFAWLCISRRKGLRLLTF